MSARKRGTLVLIVVLIAIVGMIGGGVAGQSQSEDSNTRPEVADGIRPENPNRSATGVSDATPGPQIYIVVAHGDEAINRTQLGRYGTVGTQVDNRVEVTMSPNARDAVSNLSWVVDLRRARMSQPVQVAGSGSNTSLGVSELHQRGVTGDGVRVGVIDAGFRPDNPYIADNVVAVERFTDPSETRHGTLTAQTVVQTAPDTGLYLATASTATDTAAAIDYLRRQDVDVIVMSRAYPGFDDDGDHVLAERVSQARAAGSLVVFSAGNQRQRHWQGEFQDTDADGFLEWSGADERQCIPDCTREFQGALTIIVDYPRDGDGSDYAADVINPRSQTVVQTSRRAFVSEDHVFEVIQGELAAQAIDLQVRHTAGPADDTIEIHVFGDTPSIERPVPQSSVTPPADAEDAVSVAAYARQEQQTAFYSSRGPTDDLRQAPRITGYTNIDDPAGVYTGTSAAAPYVAGIAALAQSASSATLNPDELERALTTTADDIGSTGTDARSGAGVVNADAAVSSVSEQFSPATAVESGARVFQGEDDIQFGSEDIDALTGVRGDAEGQVLRVPIPQNQTVGTYSADGTDTADVYKVTVTQPRVTTFEIRNEAGEDVAGESVAKSNAETLIVYVEFNYARYEGVELTVTDPSGLEIQRDVVSGSNPRAASGTGTQALTFPVDLSGQETGTYTITAAGSDDFDSGAATTTSTLTTTQSSASEFTLTSQPANATVTQGETTTVAYTAQNPTMESTSVLLEFPNRPANITVQSVNSANVSQPLLGSSPPGVVSTPVSPGEATTVGVTFAVAADAAPRTETVTAKATLTSGEAVETTTTTTSVTVNAQSSLVARFGGGDGEIDNLDVLRAVNAANTGGEIGGERVTNLDVLRLVNRVNS